MSEAFRMFSQMTFEDLFNVTGSLELQDGPLQPASPAGQMTEKSGPRPAPASRSRSPAKAQELLMRGTYGPTFSASSVPDGPLSSWESRLRQRLGRIGSSECDLTWKASAMSDGVLLSRLVPSTPRTVEIDCGLLLEADYWRTPQATVTEARSNVVKLTGRKPSDPQVGLPDQVMATAAYWSTPRASDGEKGGPNQSFGAGGQPLPAQAFQTALYPTPSASGFEAADAQRLMERREQCKESTGNGNGFGLTLGQFACLESAMWPTATAVDGKRGLTTRPQDTGIPLPQRVGQVLGIPPAGSSATTAKRGVLNPAFPCWLMGYPAAHLSCGGTAMQSFHSSRRK